MAEKRFLLDSNIFIAAARQYYPFDFAPGFWKCLETSAHNGRIRSIDRVRDELLLGKDDLADWAKSVFDYAFESTNDPNTLKMFGDIMAWVQTQSQFMDAAKAEFAACADGWLVAHAKTRGFVVVTHERFSADARKRVLIPNVCKAFNVDYIDTWEMLRTLGVKLG